MDRISPEKDLDGISPVNLAKVFAGDKTGFAPCTAEAVVEMLDFAGIDVTGKRVTVVGRSLVSYCLGITTLDPVKIGRAHV